MTAEARSEELERLVEKTTGLQPWRRVLHAANGTTIVLLLTIFPVPRWTAVGLLGAGTLLLMAFDLFRLRNLAAQTLFFRLFPALVSPREAVGIASSTWYMVGVVATLALFPRPEAVSAILVLALCDPVASYVGRRWGSRALLGGTVEGTTAFVSVGLVVLVFRHPWPIVLPAVLIAALAERRSWPLDDNVGIPLVTGGILTALGGLIG